MGAAAAARRKRLTFGKSTLTVYATRIKSQTTSVCRSSPGSWRSVICTGNRRRPWLQVKCQVGGCRAQTELLPAHVPNQPAREFHAHLGVLAQLEIQDLTPPQRIDAQRSRHGGRRRGLVETQAIYTVRPWRPERLAEINHDLRPLRRNAGWQGLSSVARKRQTHR
jgi:hypothetical protein